MEVLGLGFGVLGFRVLGLIIGFRVLRAGSYQPCLVTLGALVKHLLLHPSKILHATPTYPEARNRSTKP